MNLSAVGVSAPPVGSFTGLDDDAEPACSLPRPLLVAPADVVAVQGRAAGGSQRHSRTTGQCSPPGRRTAHPMILTAGAVARRGRTSGV
jgi:hypothetical protein